jgi:ssDNA-binding Zn-finger/Zn-ribbon topoisomerase 1
MQVVCNLCRCRFEVEPGPGQEVRCPRCGGKVRQEQLKGAATGGAPPLVRLGCPHCLRVIPQISAGSCPYCGQAVPEEQARRLGESLAGLDGRIKRRLLEGASASELVGEITALGATSEKAFAFVDRFVEELPFERHAAWKQGARPTPPPVCDSCGVAAELSPHEAEWTLKPEELKRYSPGWGGFEGAYAEASTYARRALYYLCPRCAKNHRAPEFASGYPARFGYQIARFSRVKV